MPLQGFAFAGAPMSRRLSFNRSTCVSVSPRWVSRRRWSCTLRAAFTIFGSALTSCFSA